MQRISGYFISLLIISCSISASAQDSIKVHLNIRAGIDIYGPAVYYDNRNNFNAEGFIALERENKKTIVLEGGYQNFKYSQYNYSYISNGIFVRGGFDFNLIKPYEAAGKYFAGLGIKIWH